MAYTKDEIKAKIIEMAKLVKDANADYYAKSLKNLTPPDTEVSFGRKYAKILVVDDSGRRVHSFVNLTNGDILKAATFNAPAKHARGNVFDANCGRGTAWNEIGANYLR